MFKDRFGDVDPINTKLYYDKIRQNAFDKDSVRSSPTWDALNGAPLCTARRTNKLKVGLGLSSCQALVRELPYYKLPGTE